MSQDVIVRRNAEQCQFYVSQGSQPNTVSGIRGVPVMTHDIAKMIELVGVVD